MDAIPFQKCHLASTSKRSVDLSSLEGDGQVDGLVLEEGKAHLVLNRNFQSLLLLNIGEQQVYCLRTNSMVLLGSKLSQHEMV